MIPSGIEPKKVPGPLKRIAFHGDAGSGKSSAAAVLVQLGFVEIALADPMKRFMAEVFGVGEEVWGPSHMRNLPLKKLGMATPRNALQRLGTEWARSYDPDIWVKYLLGVVAQLEEIQQDGLSAASYDRKRGVEALAGRALMEGVVVSDVRFENEATYLRRAGFTLVHIKGFLQLPGTDEEWRQHASEGGIAVAPGDKVIHNTGTLEELEEQVQALVKE